MATKLRVMLSTALLEAITSNSELNYNSDFFTEITRVIKPALLKAGAGVSVTYTTRELTLEEKVKRNIATEEELEQYQSELMNSI